MKHITIPFDDALIITTEINAFDVERILMEFVSSTNVLFLATLLSMGKTNKELKKLDFPLIRYAVKTTTPLD